MVEVARAHHREHRPEHLLLCEAVADLDVREDGEGGEVPALGPSPHEQLRALCAPERDVLIDLRAGVGVDHRADADGGVIGRADGERSRGLDEPRDEGVVVLGQHDHAAARRALLPLEAEGRG